jgi:hypothetical protein
LVAFSWGVLIFYAITKIDSAVSKVTTVLFVVAVMFRAFIQAVSFL